MVCAAEGCANGNTTKDNKVLQYLVSKDPEIEAALPFALREGHCGRLCRHHSDLQRVALKARQAMPGEPFQPTPLPLVPVSPSKQKPGPKGKLSEEEKVFASSYIFYYLSSFSLVFHLSASKKRKKKKEKRKKEKKKKN